MEEINLFREKLQQLLHWNGMEWNGARLAFVSMFLIALMRVKTVNLAEIATGFRGKAKVESYYQDLRTG
nr:hypothetical protein [Pseudanabaena mucicola]